MENKPSVEVTSFTNIFPHSGQAFYYDGKNYEACIKVCPDLWYVGEPANKRERCDAPTNGMIVDVCFPNTWVLRADNGDLFMVSAEIMSNTFINEHKRKHYTDMLGESVLALYKPNKIPEFKSPDAELDKKQPQRYINIPRVAEREKDEADFRVFKEQQESLRRSQKYCPGMSAEELVYLRKNHPEAGF